MLGYVNVLEEILVRETYRQIDELRPEIQSKIKVSEVLSYSLNRLPPLFVTSMSGWDYQYVYAVNELKPLILQLVRQGIKNVLSGDPLHDLTPLPDHLFTNSASVLYQLSQILGRKYLRWRDVPALVEAIAMQSTFSTKIYNQAITQSDEETVLQDESYLSKHTQALLSSTKRFREKRIAKQKEQVSKQQSYESPSWSVEKKANDAAEMEHRALQCYTLQAQLGLVNVLDHIVLRTMEKTMKPELYNQINRAEVAAYALNRLPPMYATSDRGFKHLRQKVVNEFSRELVAAVRTGAMKVLQASREDVVPIYAYQFENEYRQAMQLLRKFFNREDISIDNIVSIVQDLLLSKCT